MMKKICFYDIFIWIATFFLFVGIFFMPERVPVHWNVNWNVDRYGSRYELLLISLSPIAIYYGMLLMKKIDPRHEKIALRNKTYELMRKGLSFFFVVLSCFFYYIVFHSQTNGTFIMCLLFGILFIGVGNYMPRFPQNYFLGIRTPWTLNDEVNWKITHRIGGYLFLVGGLVIIISAFLSSKVAFIVLMVVIFMVSIGSYMISYLFYRKHHNEY